MKDIPFFTTEYGVASLMLAEIPYRQEAYIRVLDAQPGQLDALIRECVDFCRAAGAERIYWSAGDADGRLHALVYQMQGTARPDPEKVEHLFPVTQENAAKWRQIYNERMAQVDNAATLTAADEKRLLASGGGYFIHRSGQLLGIGWLDGNKLLAIATVEPGSGQRVMHTLMSLIEGGTMTLEVASTNHRAIRLYEELGFLKTQELRRWYYA